MKQPMKLSRIPGIEPTVKHSFSLKQSTWDQLEGYVQFVKEQTGVEVVLKDVVEQMLLDFMGDDKVFQKYIKQASAPVSSTPPVAPVAGAQAYSGSTGHQEQQGGIES